MVTGCQNAVEKELPHPAFVCPVTEEPVRLSGPLFACGATQRSPIAVEFRIDRMGKVEVIRVASEAQDPEEVSRCVVAAMQEWLYVPAKDCEGTPVPFVVSTEFAPIHDLAVRLE